MSTGPRHAAVAARNLYVSVEHLRGEGACGNLVVPTFVPIKSGEVVLLVVRGGSDEVLGQALMLVVGRRPARPERRVWAGVAVCPLNEAASAEIARLRALAGEPRSELARFDTWEEAALELRAIATGGVGLFPIEADVPPKSTIALTVVGPAASEFRFCAETAFSVRSNCKRLVAVRAASAAERRRVIEQVERKKA